MRATLDFTYTLGRPNVPAARLEARLYGRQDARRYSASWRQTSLPDVEGVHPRRPERNRKQRATLESHYTLGRPRGSCRRAGSQALRQAGCPPLLSPDRDALRKLGSHCLDRTQVQFACS